MFSVVKLQCFVENVINRAAFGGIFVLWHVFDFEFPQITTLIYNIIILLSGSYKKLCVDLEGSFSRCAVQ